MYFLVNTLALTLWTLIFYGREYGNLQVNTRQQTERIDVKTAKKKEIRGSSGDRGEERSTLERGTQSRGTLLQVLQV